MTFSKTRMFFDISPREKILSRRIIFHRDKGAFVSDPEVDLRYEGTDEGPPYLSLDRRPSAPDSTYPTWYHFRPMFRSGNAQRRRSPGELANVDFVTRL